SRTRPGFDDEFWQQSHPPSRVPEISFNYGHRSAKESACNCRERLTRATCVRQFSMVVTVRVAATLQRGTTNNRIQTAAVSAHATGNKRQNHNPDEIKAMGLTVSGKYANDVAMTRCNGEEYGARSFER
ncbi:unnamed protein product, partial [Heterotrigona itama]